MPDLNQIFYYMVKKTSKQLIFVKQWLFNVSCKDCKIPHNNCMGEYMYVSL